MENNKLIAEFMGLKAILIKPDVYAMSKTPWLSVTGDTPEKVMADFCKSTEYHSDWNWLMPVIEKCFTISLDIEVGNRIMVINDALLTINKSEIYNAVIEFIKWYNKKTVKKNYTVVVACELAIEVNDVENEEQARDVAENYELPWEYREDTFEIIEVVPEIE